MTTSRKTQPSFRLEILVQPRARRNELVGWQGAALKLRVTAPPVEGAANHAVIQLIASVLAISKSRVRLARGDTSRTKLLEIDGPEASSRLRLEHHFVDKKSPRD
ncbi:MAG TPA: DUF167 domain-containing protein [Terriglobales bacterium]|nr:DUF167 domain-containing protein [Terriglobales bacterium]